MINGLFSCEEQVALNFSETALLLDKQVRVEVNLPKAEGNTVSAVTINQTLKNYVLNALAVENAKDLNQGLEAFNQRFIDFKDKTPSAARENLVPWEASFDGEITYFSGQVISIAINEYLHTGGVHGTVKVLFFNFDLNNGKLLLYEDFLNDELAFKKILMGYFEEEVGPIQEADFTLPASMGLSEEGLIILYNAHELPSFNDELVEFTIPFDRVYGFLEKY